MKPLSSNSTKRAPGSCDPWRQFRVPAGLRVQLINGLSKHQGRTDLCADGTPHSTPGFIHPGAPRPWQLITQRSLVQIQPPQPRNSTGYGARRSPLGFSRNGRLEITAPNLVVRVQIIRRFTDNPGSHPGQPDPDEPIAPAQREGRRAVLWYTVSGWRRGEVLESDLVVAATEERADVGVYDDRPGDGVSG